VEAKLKVGGQARFSAVDASGATVQATFRVLGGGASIDGTGRFHAPSQPGVFRIQALSMSDPNRTGEATAKVEAFSGQIVGMPDGLIPRTGHTATLLEDGDVLVLGGWASSTPERFSPRTGTWATAASHGSPRVDHTATSLPGGRVLIAGGEGAAGLYRSALIYEGGAFTAIPESIDAPRRRHTATALLDGRVLLAGGLPTRGSEVDATNGAEIFDPALFTFRATASMAHPRTDHTATRLLDGRVLVVGGRDSTCSILCPSRVWASAEIFDPRTGAFTDTGSMALARHNHTATLLPDGRVLIAGGTTPDLPYTDIADSVEIYDPATSRFTPGGRMLKRRTEHQAVLLGNGKVLLSGGRTEGEVSMASATVEAFDAADSTSRLATSDKTTRYRHASVRLENGVVLLIGGSEGGGPIKAVERYE
jgi:hypothetical protein